LCRKDNGVPQKKSVNEQDKQKEEWWKSGTTIQSRCPQDGSVCSGNEETNSENK
jgi:hypothetical protein